MVNSLPLVDSVELRCPGEPGTIDRAIHLSRLLHSHEACRSCAHRHDTAGLNRRQLQRLAQGARLRPHESPWQSEAYIAELGGRFSTTTAYTLAAAFTAWLAERLPTGRSRPRILFGGDGRMLAAGHTQALLDGLRLAGGEVQTLGTTSGAVMAQAVAEFEADGGLLLANLPARRHTLSLSFWGRRGKPLSSPGGLDEIRRLTSGPPVRLTRRAAALQVSEVTQRYLERLQPLCHGLRPLRIVCALADPVQRGWLALLLDNSACERIELADHQRTTASLSTTVRQSRAHFGVVTDGLGEMCTLVDELGNVVAPAQFAAAITGEPVVKPLAQTTREAVFETCWNQGLAGAADAAGRVWLGCAPAVPDGLGAIVRLLALLSQSDAPLSAALGD